jgi:hypothetical protein
MLADTVRACPAPDARLPDAGHTESHEASVATVYTSNPWPTFVRVSDWLAGWPPPVASKTIDVVDRPIFGIGLTFRDT